MPESSDDGLAIVAGRGALPRLLAEDCAARGRTYRVVVFGGVDLDWLAGQPVLRAAYEKPGRLFDDLRAAGCRRVTFAGGIARPRLRPFAFDFKMLRLAPRLLRGIRSGDDSTLRLVAAIFEAEGFRLVAAHDILPDLVATAGVLGAHAPSAADRDDADRAAAIVAALGAADVGQAAVVAGGICLGLEFDPGHRRPPRLRRPHPAGVAPVRPRRALQGAEARPGPPHRPAGHRPGHPARRRRRRPRRRGDRGRRGDDPRPRRHHRRRQRRRPLPLGARAVSLFAVEDLSASIHGLPILHDVAMAADAGEVLGVIGESGSGKSMTALAVMGLLPTGAETRGRILLDGADLLARTEAEMCRIRGRDIGMIFQEPMTALNPLQTIGAQVAETVRIHHAAGRREAREIARDTLDRVGLPAARFPLSRYPHQLSGGQRQRVGIAMAIALRPKLLIADEPTTALDVTTQAQILTLLRRLVDADGMALMLITHDLAVVADLADRLAIMNAGRVVEAGPAADVFRERRHPYTRALFAASAHQPERLARVARAPLLEVDGLVRDYPGPRTGLFGGHEVFHAVRGVSLTLHQGESLGLVGESGCGKSTLGRAILGLEALQGGTVRIEGEPVRAGERMPRSLRAKMQAVFQDPYGSFNPRHKVGRLVAEPFHLLLDAPRGRGRREAVGQALLDVGLAPSDADKYIHEFSGGQRQRIAIARALIIRPKLIILDEAVSALDVQVRAQILDLLADLMKRYHLSYLFISHDLHVVKAITDRVMVMKAGEIVERGTTKDVFEAPQHPYTRELMAASPVLEMKV